LITIINKFELGDSLIAKLLGYVLGGLIRIVNYIIAIFLVKIA